MHLRAVKKWRAIACYVALAITFTAFVFLSSIARANGGAVTGGFTVPLIISDVSASDINYDSATISWLTDVNATSQVYFSITSHSDATSYAYYTPESLSLLKVHSLTLDGLPSSTTYHYRVRSRIPGTGSVATSNDAIFRTLAAPLPLPGFPAGGGAGGPRVAPERGVFNQDVTAKSEDAKVQVAIKRGTIGLVNGSPVTQISIAKVADPPAPPAQFNTVGLVYDLGPEGATFNPPITIAFTYDLALMPSGVAEQDLVVATHDKAADKWTNLTSVVDPLTHIITAKANHFTAFAVLAYVPPAVPSSLPTDSDALVAAFSVRALSISPTEVNVGESVNISVLVSNTGDQAGSHTVTLKIANVPVATQTVSLAGHTNQAVTFVLSEDTAGTYTATVERLSGKFKVKTTSAPFATPTLTQAPASPSAAFTTSALTITPAEVNIGEVVAIRLTLTNTGSISGTSRVTLKIDGTVEATKNVTLAARESQKVTFTTKKNRAGTYSLDVNGLTGSFRVKETVGSSLTGQRVNWTSIGGVIAAMTAAVGVLFFVLRKRPV